MTGSLGEYAKSLMRIVAGLLFACHGCQKLFGLFGGVPPGTGGKVELFSLLGLAGVLETVGGILILVGLFTRITAFILSGEMAVAFFKVHLARGFWPIKNGGEPAVLYCFIFLYLAATGAGLLSLDHAIWSKKAKSG